MVVKVGQRGKKVEKGEEGGGRKRKTKKKKARFDQGEKGGRGTSTARERVTNSPSTSTPLYPSSRRYTNLFIRGGGASLLPHLAMYLGSEEPTLRFDEADSRTTSAFTLRLELPPAAIALL